MTDPAEDDLDARLRVVEREVSRLREQVALSTADAAAARVIAAGADRDVAEVRAELRAHTQVLNALRETQLDHGDVIAALCTEVHDLQTEVHDLRTEMRNGFAMVNTGMAQITALLTGIAGTGQE